MQTTTNLGLKKPATTDKYNVQDFNDNADILDGFVTKVASGTAYIPVSTQEVEVDLSAYVDYENYSYFVLHEITSELPNGGTLAWEINSAGILRFRRVSIAVTNEVYVDYKLFAIKLV